jgi:isopropylmalate/homocitrate/citramalate synthase
VRLHREAGVPIAKIIVMAAFGCNFAGDVSPAEVVATVSDALAIAREADIEVRDVALADSMGWATPKRVAAAVGAVRERWDGLRIALHLHDTRGQGIACAYEGLRLGVTAFDAAVAGLGGCPFAGQPGAPGNIATEELALLCEEMGISTGLNIEALIEAGRLAERIVGHRLPSAALRSGTLGAFRRRTA